MGTYLKGNSKYYRSIGQNVLLASYWLRQNIIMRMDDLA